jgi:predicted DNA-binding transcriptional regulator YafY
MMFVRHPGARIAKAYSLSVRSGHSSQKIKQNADNSIILTMTCPITDTLVRWILQMAGNVKVLAPRRLRELVFSQATELAGNNQ